ncbi:MAG TPA: SdiA-regulated domain-containing protein [Flavitalea sp.]|nr:SdiA-regulated domain-containing protein [Flavitalea sp.]
MISIFQAATLLSVPALCLSLACAESQAHSSPADYDLKSPVVHKMESALDEISGIAFKPGDDQTLYAIEDEHANFYRLTTDGKIEGKTDFGKKGDYEDLAITDSAAYVLRSDGTILQADIRENPEKTASTKTQNALPPGEYEGMAVESENSLIALCKDCKVKGAKGKLILYKLSIEPMGQIKAGDPIIVPVEEGEKKTKLAPSGLARNPVNGHWYIISSVNKMLIVLNPDFSSPVSYTLDPTLFPQPEGICFNSKGTLFISNEAAGGSASILEFKRK